MTSSVWPPSSCRRTAIRRPSSDHAGVRQKTAVRGGEAGDLGAAGGLQQHEVAAPVRAELDGGDARSIGRRSRGEQRAPVGELAHVAAVDVHDHHVGPVAKAPAPVRGGSVPGRQAAGRAEAAEGLVEAHALLPAVGVEAHQGRRIGETALARQHAAVGQRLREPVVGPDARVVLPGEDSQRRRGQVLLPGLPQAGQLVHGALVGPGGAGSRVLPEGEAEGPGEGDGEEQPPAGGAAQHPVPRLGVVVPPDVGGQVVPELVVVRVPVAVRAVMGLVVGVSPPRKQQGPDVEAEPGHAPAPGLAQGRLDAYRVPLPEPRRHEQEAGNGLARFAAQEPPQADQALAHAVELHHVAHLVDRQQLVPLAAEPPRVLGRGAEPHAAPRGQGDETVGPGRLVGQHHVQRLLPPSEGSGDRAVDVFQGVGHPLGLGGDLRGEDDLEPLRPDLLPVQPRRVLLRQGRACDQQRECEGSLQHSGRLLWTRAQRAQAEAPE